MRIMTQKSKKKVIVSGCFDLLHSGHIAFLRSAAQLGDLYVCLGSDHTVFELKHKYPVNPELERRFMLSSVKYVYEVCISSGSGYLDFLPELERIQPDIFVVNHDGHSPEKQALCKERGIEYVVLDRIPEAGLPARSTTAIRSVSQIPYRLDLAGGWLDQPFVSRYAAGPVLTICLEPEIVFNERSGMATSTRNVAIGLWKDQLPEENSEKIAQIVFAVENPPGKTEIAGSQDAIGIVFTGLTKSQYTGEYWPHTIENIQEESILQFIENYVFLVPLGPRKSGYNVLHNTYIEQRGAAALAKAANDCWDALHDMNLHAFAQAVTASFEAQIAMFPNMVDTDILESIRRYASIALGWKISGAGGGGYLVIVTDKPLPEMQSIHIRRLKKKYV